MIGRAGVLAIWICGAGASAAAGLDLTLPQAAQQTAERVTSPDSYRAPRAVFGAEGVPSLEVAGTITRRAWRIPAQGLTTLQVIQPLRAQLEAQGYDIVFDCADAVCGGFDFRFAIEVLPGPNMYVNIGRYRFLTAVRGQPDAPDAAVTVLASATTASAYVQIIHAAPVPASDAPAGAFVGLPAAEPVALPPDRGAADLSDAASVREALQRRGVVVLTGLDFDSGSTDLGAGPFPVLSALGAVLNDEPEWRVALVGHTDTVGGLAPNIALSRARASSVRARLIETFGLDPARLDAEGMGYLAPVASNLTAAGRAGNRRVEAVLLSVD